MKNHKVIHITYVYNSSENDLYIYKLYIVENLVIVIHTIFNAKLHIYYLHKYLVSKKLQSYTHNLSVNVFVFT